MNRLTAAVKGTASANFWYDGFNRICTWQQNGSATARFNVYDGWDLVAEDKAGNVLDTEYLHGAGSDELVGGKQVGVSVQKLTARWIGVIAQGGDHAWES